MKFKPTRTLLASLLMTAVLTALTACGAPVPLGDDSLPLSQPAAVSAPAEHPPAPADSVPGVPSAGTPLAQPATSAETLLTRTQAVTIALNHAGLTAAQVKGLHSEYDVDDGVKEWDVEFWHDGWEYDYEINAVSGTIRAFDKERD